jgi:hypothetical protein
MGRHQLCSTYRERKPFSFAKAPLNFFAESVWRWIFAALMPPVIAEPMGGNNVLRRCLPSRTVPNKVLSGALKVLRLLWG